MSGTNASNGQVDVRKFNQRIRGELLVVARIATALACTLVLFLLVVSR